jgi:hypothetical protein
MYDNRQTIVGMTVFSSVSAGIPPYTICSTHGTGGIGAVILSQSVSSPAFGINSDRLAMPGEIADIVIDGPSLVRVSPDQATTIIPGQWVKSAAGGTAVVAAVGEASIGMCLKRARAGELMEIMVRPCLCPNTI